MIVSPTMRVADLESNWLYSVPLSEGQDISLLEQVISDQRQILSDVFNTTDVTTIPQMWCLCKEVHVFERMHR